MVGWIGDSTSVEQDHFRFLRDPSEAILKDSSEANVMGYRSPLMLVHCHEHFQCFRGLYDMVIKSRSVWALLCQESHSIVLLIVDMLNS